ncbi:MAG: ATP-binding protein [Pseudomonadota bacterium]
MIISVASGKGGTGKTTIATNLAVSIGEDVQILDCDVEEPNAHLFLNPIIKETKKVMAPVPSVDEDKCTFCGKCAEICQFKAIIILGKTILTFPEMCHSCGGCMEVCPAGAVSETGRELGVIETGNRNGVEFVHGRLKVGEAMSPPLIRMVRSFTKPELLTIIDAPPGTSCPVITSMKGSNFILLVTEPTPFGLHDLKLAVEAVRILGIPHGLVINRSDIGDGQVKDYAAKNKIKVLMEIPYSRKIAEAYSIGQLIVDAIPKWREKFLVLNSNIKELADLSYNQVIS